MEIYTDALGGVAVYDHHSDCRGGIQACVKKLKKEHEKSEAIAAGVQSLLRESIVGNYNKYTDKGYCPIYAKESIKHAYDAYHNLKGNDVATKLYKTILAMPEEPKEKED